MAAERVDREEVLFRDYTGEEGVAEDMVLCQFLVQSLCDSGPWVRVAEIVVGRRLDRERSGRGHVVPFPGAVFVLLWSLGQSGRNSGRDEVPLVLGSG